MCRLRSNYSVAHLLQRMWGNCDLFIHTCVNLICDHNQYVIYSLLVQPSRDAMVQQATLCEYPWGRVCQLCIHTYITNTAGDC